MNDFIFTTLREAVWTQEQLDYQQLLRLHHRGYCFLPTQKMLKHDAQSPRSDVKGIISLSDVSGMQSPAISPKRGEITGLCSSSGTWVHDRQIDIFTEYQTAITTCKIGKIQPDGEVFLWKRKSQRNRLTCMERLCCYTDAIKAVKIWIIKSH